jgi:solute:Na+ symporter, SSS family
MILTTLDWALIAAYFLASLLIGLYYSRRGGKDVGEYFLSGRSLPWWLAGTSMVATTFAADTPLAVAGLVARNGVAGNWIWWNGAFGGMLTVFFFARLWRRAGILTDVEFAELRYTGRPAALLRGFRALYLGIPINCVVMGWVNLAMAKILSVTMGYDRLTAVLLSLAITGFYSALSGLWGVVVTDFFQFIFAMGGTIALAYFALRLPEIGGISGLVQQLPPDTFEFLPRIGDTAAETCASLALPAAAFFAYVGVQWWASWYPGQEPGGGGYVAQRMMSAKTSGTRSSRPSGSRSRTTASGRGRGFSLALPRLSCTPISPTRKPATSWWCGTTSRPAGAACCSARSSPPTCPRLPRSSIGVRRTS